MSDAADDASRLTQATRPHLSVPESVGRDRWRHIERLFHVARDMPEQARMDFLDAEAGADADLRTELQALLDADQAARGRLDEVVTEAIISWLRSDCR